MDRQGWDERYAATELLWTSEPNRFLVEEVADLPPGRALDLGAGEGRNGVWLAERGWQVTAVDFSAVGLEKARRLAAARGVDVDWVEADLTEYAPEEDRFDLVVILYLHLVRSQLEIVLDRASRALAEGGVLLSVGHDRRNLAEGHGGPQDPAILHDADELVAMLAGLAVERAERVRRPVETDAGTVEAIDTLVRAVRPAGARRS